MESTNRSRLGQMGSSGSNRRKCCQRVYATGAMAIGVPGWPELERYSTVTQRAEMLRGCRPRRAPDGVDAARRGSPRWIDRRAPRAVDRASASSGRRQRSRGCRSSVVGHPADVRVDVVDEPAAGRTIRPRPDEERTKPVSQVRMISSRRWLTRDESSKAARTTGDPANGRRVCLVLERRPLCYSFLSMKPFTLPIKEST